MGWTGWSTLVRSNHPGSSLVKCMTRKEADSSDKDGNYRMLKITTVKKFVLLANKDEFGGKENSYVMNSTGL